MAATWVPRVFCGSPLISLALKNTNNFLAPLRSFTAVLSHSFHVSTSDSKQYHNTRRKRMLRRFKLNQLQAKLERLDEEDRPTGCLLCPMRGDVEIDYKNVRLLSQFVSPHTGRIYGRTLTGFMPVTMKYLEFHEDPNLF